jgi:HEPN domain-containing protein
MSSPDPWTRGATIWLVDAEEDLAAALEIMQRLGKAQPRHVAFLAQQAAEKAIKAALTYGRAGGMEPTHDIAALLRALPDDGTWTTRSKYKDVSALTSYAVDARYRVNNLTVTAAQARSACNLAQGILNSCMRDMEAHGFTRDAPSADAGGGKN